MAKRTDKYSHSKDNRISNGILIGVGSAFVVATGGLCFFGGKSAVNAMNNEAGDAIVGEIRRLNEERAEANKPEETAVPEDQWTTDQMKWMQENHITWNEEGYPINERGEVVDDPTTAVDEVAKWEAYLEEKTRPESVPEPTPEPTPTPAPLPEKPAWCYDNPLISIDEDGRLYYVTKEGDTLAWIAKQTGFTPAELADYNGIDDVNAVLPAGTRIYFPLQGPATDIESTRGLG